MLKTVAIEITGKVQGVFFRKYTLQTGRRLNLCGFVRNLTDGSVYVEATGSELQLKELVAWCHKGSPLAVVKQVLVREISVIHKEPFQIL
ncbi:MAG: acylphosphatase [Bacteroidia bacterium]|jgi:acylphosphatase